MSARVAVAATFRLVRWGNAIVAAGGVVAGAWWAARALDAPVALAALAAISLTAFANAYNDLRDRDIDALAHPERPLPRGELRPAAVQGIAIAAALSALIFARLAAPALGALTVAVLAAMALYSAWLKRRGVAGNVLVAVLASLPFLYGAWAIGRPRSALPLLALAMPLHFAREIAKDLDDIEGDRPHRRTLPLVMGAGLSRAAVAVSVALFVGVATGIGVERPVFLLACAPTILLSIAAAWRVDAGRRGGPLLLKAAMVCALGALLAAAPGA